MSDMKKVLVSIRRASGHHGPVQVSIDRAIDAAQAGRASLEDLVLLLGAQGADEWRLLERAREVKERSVGRRVYFRGLVELSNVCRKSCFYCGVRAGNAAVERYTLEDDEVLEAVRAAARGRLASVVIQAGERGDEPFVARVERLLRRIARETGGTLRVTLSLGEQDEAVYRRWLAAGATRYLLRIETTNPALFATLHPADGRHAFQRRLAALGALERLGYQTGTGVMIGLPGQTLEDVARDLLFFHGRGFPMFGIGPYVEHAATPLHEQRARLLPPAERLALTLRALAVLRLLMPDVNIAATTALQAIDPMGRERALRVAANVVMPNLTPARRRRHYALYDGKPGLAEDPDDSLGRLDARLALAGCEPAWGEWGDSRRFSARRGWAAGV